MSDITTHNHGCSKSQLEERVAQLEEIVNQFKEMGDQVGDQIKETLRELANVLKRKRPANELKETQQTKRRKAIAASKLVHIFIDLSNVFCEGSKELQQKLNTKGINFCIQRLIATILNGREKGEIYMVGSIPRNAHEDERKFQEQMIALGYHCKICERNSSDKEKGVDVELGRNMMKVIHDESPSTLVLVSGDGDFCSMLDEATEEQWGVEIWSWFRGMSNALKKWPYVKLEDHYGDFAYVNANKSDQYETLKISGEIIKHWKHDMGPIIRSYCNFNLLCRLHWVDETTVHLYFDTMNDRDKVRSWLSKKYQNELTDLQGWDMPWQRGVKM